MPLALPPKMLIRGDAATAAHVYRQLTSVVAGHPGALTTYTFYEELDSWLGPWGSTGYPIGYGKFYNVLFTSNQKLMGNAATKQWVWQPTIRLQEALRDYVVGRVRAGTLSTLSEPELRGAAFASHPLAYDQGGLATLVLVAPELLHIIATIPSAEFDPRSKNFSVTLTQVFATIELVAPKVAGGGLAGLAGPAHTGILSIAVAKDRRELLNEIAVGRELVGLKAEIARGALDHVPWLDQLIDRLNAREFYDQGAARAAREVVQAALIRRQRLVDEALRQLQQSPEVRWRVQQAFPRALQPRLP